MSKKEFLNKIPVWLKNSKKLVIAIDGYSGAGKTILLKKIEKDYKNVLAVYMDDFILERNKRLELIKQAKNKSEVFELQWYDYDNIKELIGQFKKQLSSAYKAKIYNPDTNKNDIAKSYDLTI